MALQHEKTQLPTFILVDLYKDTLVQLNEAQTTVKKMPDETVVTEKNFLGDNKKFIAIIVKDPSAVHLNDADLNFLSGILQACKFNLGDVAIINQHQNGINFAQLKKELSPLFYILFDVAATDIDLPFTIPNYQVQPYDGSKFLIAPSLAFMQGASQESKLEKSRLWLSLKKMFDIA
jgi:hypothetical protein